jgi:ubiquinone/menaquinone biosynthesis C-methylase UbiE
MAWYAARAPIPTHESAVSNLFNIVYKPSIAPKAKMTGRKTVPITRREYFKEALQLAKAGKLTDLSNRSRDETFRGGLHRFSRVAYEVRNRKKVLDIGPGDGLLLSLLNELGHECYAIDWTDLHLKDNPEVYLKKGIVFKKCMVEIDPIPYPDNFFDALTCCQVLEHFTHSHLHAIREMYRVLRPGGIVEIDVPNAVDFRSRWRVLRGKHITWDYEKEYLYKKPIIYGKMSFYDRHNREFTKKEVEILLRAGGFEEVRVSFLRAARYRTGIQRIRSIGSMIRDLVPSFRKSIIGTGIKKIQNRNCAEARQLSPAGYAAVSSCHPPTAEAFGGGRSSPCFRTGHPGERE